MFYDGNEIDFFSPGTSGIGHATSPDGIHWTKDAANPVLPNSTAGWDTHVYAPFVILEDHKYKMWYSSEKQIGYAWSPDSAVTAIPTAGLQLWLRSDAGLDTLDGKVGRWHDQSGNGNDAIQSNVDRQPLFVGGELNQKPVLRFDGFDDKLGFTGTTPMSQFTLFMVVKNYSGGAEHNSHVITFGPLGGSPTQGFAVLWGGFDRVPDLILFGNGNGGMFASAPNIAANGEWRIISIVFQTRFNTTLRWNGNNATMSVNEPGPSFFGPLGDPTGSGGGIGGADGVPLLTAKCDFAEAIVYDTLLTDSQRLAIEQYLNGKYDIFRSQAILSVDTPPVSCSTKTTPTPSTRAQPSSTICLVIGSQAGCVRYARS